MAELTKLTDPGAVTRAMREADRLGRSAFLEKYGFGTAREYFVEHNGRYYDSKAITAVAYGLQYPKEGPLRWQDFSGGKYSVEIALGRLGFRVVPNPYRYLVFTENEVHARPEFSKWRDVTGERYHFPNSYRNKIVPGRQFIYYKGSRRKGGGRGTPEYFGWGRIGTVSQDPTTAGGPAARRNWLCDIEDYREFRMPVPFRAADQTYLELGSKKAPTRYWETGVREISDKAFGRILKLAGIFLTKPRSVETPTNVQEGDNPFDLLVLGKKKTSDSDGSTTYGGRGGGRAKEIGDHAERIALAWLQSKVASQAAREQIVHVAALNLTPGWDIEDRRSNPKIAYEVKATNGTQFPAIEVTANEWAAAKRLRKNYNLVLVAECESAVPQIRLLNDPWGMFEQEKLSATPVGYRLEGLRS